MITVKQLKEILNTLPDDAPVVMSGDSEGNNYSPLSGHCMGRYVPETTWYGQFYDEDDFQTEVEEGYIDEDIDSVIALCIWPIS